MRGRLVLNGTTEIRGLMGEISGGHLTLATALWLQTMVPLMAGDTVELQGYFRAADGYFAAGHTFCCGCKIGNRRAYVVSVSARGAGNGSSPLLSVRPP